jgi:hypothetical protein
MQGIINMKKAEQVISTAPAINKISFAFKRNAVRVELFDYGTEMGWGYDVRVRVFMNGTALPFGSECIHQRKRPHWLPAAATISNWNAVVATAINTIKTITSKGV